MERMPSASEMERYKQEMMNLYRRANPNLTAAPSNSPSQSNASEGAASRTVTARETETVRPAPQPVPKAVPTPNNAVSSGETVRTAPSEMPPAALKDNIFPSFSSGTDLPGQNASLPDNADERSRRPRYPEDFPEEPPYPEDTMPARRAYDDTPTESGTGEPAAADENAMIANPAYPGELVGGFDGPATSLRDLQNYVDEPLPDEYYEKYPETGYIRVRVSSSRQALPVENAGIIVSKQIDSSRHILHRETSDESGLTPNMPVPAPEGSSSTQPDANGQPRFAFYDILVDRVGYVPVFYHSVPVFSGVVTVQPVQLVPLSDNPSGRQLIEIKAPQPNEQ